MRVAMDEEGLVENMPRKMEKRIKTKSKKGEKNEVSTKGMDGTHNIGIMKANEHMQRSVKEDISEVKRHHERDKEKKSKEIKDAQEVDIKKKGARERNLIGAYGEDGAVDNSERKRKKRDKNKNKKESCTAVRIEMSNNEEVEGNERKKLPEEESVSGIKGGKEAKKERKKQKAMRNHKDVDSKNEGEKEDGKKVRTHSEYLEVNFPEMVERKKRKRDKEMSRDDECIGWQDTSSEAMLESRTNEMKKKKKKKKKKKMKKMERRNNGEADLSLLQQESIPENVEGNIQSTKYDENVTMELERKKMKKHKKNENYKDDSSASQKYISREDSEDNDSNSLLHSDGKQDNEGGDANKVKKKKTKSVKYGSNDPTPNKSNKKVRFSGQVEVFPLPGDSNIEKVNDEEQNLVRGKRFTREEDEIIKEAVDKYIMEHDLGDEGLNMVLNCSKHPIVKGCWREIGTSIPYRPYTAVYYRAQVLFRRSENRKWTQEEYDEILKYQEEHGNQWKALADELGKHRWHVKDCWRRIKLPNLNRGHWTQKEYQNLFDLVNTDLQLKVSEQKRSKHGMLRDNICWTAISDKLSTRSLATCCVKWYKQLTSPMVAEGVWADTDDYLLIGALYSLDANCMEDVEWDDLLDDRTGYVCRKRWNQMALHIGHHGNKSFAEQVEVLAQRYCPHLLEARETWDSKPRVP